MSARDWFDHKDADEAAMDAAHDKMEKAMSEEAGAPELLPCPFCGDDPVIDSGAQGPPQWSIYCKRCHAGLSLSGYSIAAKAIAAWNRRTPTAAAAVPGEAEVERVARMIAKYCYPHLVDAIDQGLTPPHMDVGNPSFATMARNILAALPPAVPQPDELVEIRQHCEYLFDALTHATDQISAALKVITTTVDVETPIDERENAKTLMRLVQNVEEILLRANQTKVFAAAPQGAGLPDGIQIISDVERAEPSEEYLRTLWTTAGGDFCRLFGPLAETAKMPEAYFFTFMCSIFRGIYPTPPSLSPPASSSDELSEAVAFINNALTEIMQQTANANGVPGDSEAAAYLHSYLAEIGSLVTQCTAPMAALRALAAKEFHHMTDLERDELERATIERCAKVAEETELRRWSVEKTDSNSIYTGEWEDKSGHFPKYKDAEKVAAAIRALASRPAAEAGSVKRAHTWDAVSGDGSGNRYRCRHCGKMLADWLDNSSCEGASAPPPPPPPPARDALVRALKFIRDDTRADAGSRAVAMHALDPNAKDTTT